ncbi:UNVERIFIED_CONTAM: hypothetical protein FKN15_047047 [Acipenser sinensis]
MAEQEDTLSIAASWDEDSFPTEMEEGEEPTLSTEAEPSSEAASEASAPLFSSSMSALMGCAANILQVPCSTAAAPHRSVFRMQTAAPLPQPFPAFQDLMEDVRSSWDRLASVASLLKPTAPLTSLECTEKLGLVGFPPVVSTIAALVNTASILTTYLHGILREAPLPEPVASELHLLSGTLLQISGLQGQALGQSLASLLVSHR